MPQRPRTPSPGPDEPKYLTVVRPYPLNANMELDGDLKQTVYWIASCIGSDPLLAVFYKPSVCAHSIDAIPEISGDLMRIVASRRVRI